MPSNGFVDANWFPSDESAGRLFLLSIDGGIQPHDDVAGTGGRLLSRRGARIATV